MVSSIHGVAGTAPQTDGEFVAPLHRPSAAVAVAVLTVEALRPAATELFELFKIPWSLYSRADADRFAAVLVSSSCSELPRASLIICTGPDATAYDASTWVERRGTRPHGWVLSYQGRQLPVYTELATFSGEYDRVLAVTDTGEAAAVVTTRDGTTVVRLGFDLFAEVRHLLKAGQPAEHALSPTLELHIGMLRDVLLQQGIPVVEIPPHPPGYPFIASLSHDIDFMGIRHHRLDATLLGFLYRACKSLLSGKDRDATKIRKNLAAVMSLPAVYLKTAPDFWNPIEQYGAIDSPRPATYFFLPFKGRPGRGLAARNWRRRAGRYDVNDYAGRLRQLEREGHEVGVHGIDAWRDADAAREEARVIEGITGTSPLGIRMHWLCNSEDTAAILERAGYSYDASHGYNDAVGYRNGTTQVFRPIGVEKLLHVPLNIQDTAMFYPDRMNLSEARARELCERLVEDSCKHGGVLAVNWHDRSLAPERNWDRSYGELLDLIGRRRPWFASIRHTVRWFDARRAVQFEDVRTTADEIGVRLKFSGPRPHDAATIPPMCVKATVPSGDPKGSHRSVFETPVDHEHDNFHVHCA